MGRRGIESTVVSTDSIRLQIKILRVHHKETDNYII